MKKHISLIYVSSATKEPQPDDIEHLLSRAKSRNTEQGVTGVLLFDKGTFMQYIEGPIIGMGIVYDAIRRDPLHTGIIELLCESITIRLFSDWAMGFRSNDLSDVSDSWLRDDILESRLDMLELEVPAGRVLRTFWDRSRFPSTSMYP